MPNLSKLMKECHVKMLAGDAPAPHGVIDFVLGPIEQCSDAATIVCVTGLQKKNLEVVETKSEGTVEQRGNLCCYKARLWYFSLTTKTTLEVTLIN